MGVLDDLDASQRAALLGAKTASSAVKSGTGIAAAAAKSTAPSKAVVSGVKTTGSAGTKLVQKADPVAPGPGASWDQFQALVDSGVFSSPSKSKGAGKKSETDNPGSSQTWDAFAKDVKNGSMGVPRAAGYGLNYNPDAGPVAFDPMRQDTTAMNESLASPPPMDVLKSVHDFLQGPYQRRVDENGGVAPFEGPIDTAGIYKFLQQPYLDQIAREQAASAPATRSVPTIPVRATIDTGWADPWSRLSSSARLPAEPLPSDVGPAPYTPDQSLQANDRLPSGEYAPSQEPASSVPLPRARPSEGIVQGLPSDAAHGDIAVGRDGNQYQYVQTNGAIGGNGDWGWTRLSSGGASNYGEPGLVTGDTSAPTAEPSTWDNVVDNTGKLLSHTGLGGIVSALFPDLWSGMGDAMKNLGANGAPGGPMRDYPSWDADRGTWRGNDPEHPRRGQNPPPPPPPPPADFPDLNHNGIDDRIEGYVPPDTGGDQFRSNRTATFPDMPPYRPGFDDEWNYFHDHLARGGVVGYADGGRVNNPDPRVMMIADAEDALQRGDHQHESITKFVDTFGPKALENLNNNVLAGYRMRAGREGARQITGPGGPTDDAVPAVIDGKHPAKLSSGEVVIPVSAVEGAGDGDPRVGAQRLQELSARLAAK
jgi:hypothetical protein